MDNITNVKIKNFKILKDVELSMSNINIITGINSAGKSTFIQSLLLLKQNVEILTLFCIHSYLEKSGDTKLKEKFKFSEKYNLNVNGEYVTLGAKEKLFNQNVYKEDIEITISKDDLKSFAFQFDSDIAVVNTSETDALFRLINLFAEDFQYISTNRTQPSSSYNLSDNMLSKNLIGTSGEFVAHYLDKFRHKSINIPQLVHENSKTDQLLENVSLWLGEISTGVELVVKRYDDVQKASLFYKYSYGEQTTDDYLPMNVGFGLTYVLPIIVAILKSKPNDLLIIENPETHLHPAAQSIIAMLCARAAANGVQIIVETHSDHFMNGIRVATKEKILKPEHTKIYYFKKNNLTMSAETHELNIDKNGKINSHWPEGFFDEYEKNLDKLLW